MHERSNARSAEWALFVAGVLYGASTPVGRQLGTWFAPPTIVALRFVFALPFCLVALRRSRRQVDVSRWRLLPVALLFPLSATLFTYSFFEASIAVAIFGFYVANLLSSLTLGVVLHGEPLDRPTIAAFTSSFVATALIAAGQQGAEAPGNALLGFAFACAAGVTATALANEQKHLGGRVDGETVTLVQVVGGVVATALFALALGDHSVVMMTGEGLALCVLYGILFFGCNRLMVYGFDKGALGLGTVLLSIEVLVGPAMAWFFFDERLGPLTLLGGVFIAAAVVATTRRKVKPELTERLDVQPGAL